MIPQNITGIEELVKIHRFSNAFYSVANRNRERNNNMGLLRRRASEHMRIYRYDPADHGYVMVLEPGYYPPEFNQVSLWSHARVFVEDGVDV